jgi:hypothetical protein
MYMLCRCCHKVIDKYYSHAWYYKDYGDHECRNVLIREVESFFSSCKKCKYHVTKCIDTPGYKNVKKRFCLRFCVC